MEFSWQFEYCVDRRQDVPTDILLANVAACARVFNNPARFPRADLEYIEGHHWEASLELNARGVVF